MELLRQDYLGLKRVPGGNDAGQDGLGQLSDGTPFVLVATTERTYARNLRKSITNYQEASGDRRAFVLATSRTVTGRRRLALPKEVKEEFGVDLVAIHAREDFVDLLYDSPTWRKKLLDLSGGVVGALVQKFGRAHAELSLGLIGRDSERDELLSASGDLILSGVPGVGKSYLLEYLCTEHDWGWLDISHDTPFDALSDDILEKRPARIILDDAHFNPDRLMKLDQLRRTMGVPFSIVGVCWPAYESDVQKGLSGARLLKLRELKRPDINLILQAVGVHGPSQLIREILDQARGRAGLAVTLARACLDEAGWDVVTGRVLAQNIIATLGRSLPPECRYELGVLSLAGEHGTTEATVASTLGRNRASVAHTIRMAASSGTIEMPPGYERLLRVQPQSLRFALVRDVFFGGPGSMPVRDVLEQFEDASIAAIPLIGAAGQDPSVDRTVIAEVIDWRNHDSAVAYGQLGAREFELAASRAPDYLADIARAAIRGDGLSEQTLTVLMAAATDAHGDPGRNEDHPMRVISDQFRHQASGINERTDALGIAEAWAECGGDEDVAARVMIHATYPGIEDVEPDPVTQNSITISRAIQTPAMIAGLANLWEAVLDFLGRHPRVPPRIAFGGLEPWLYPNGLLLGDAEAGDRGHELREVGAHVVAQLRAMYRDRPLAVRKLALLAHHTDIEIDVEEDPLVFALCASRPAGDPEGLYKWEVTEAEQDVVMQLVHDRTAVSAIAQAGEIIAIEREAAAAEIGPPRLLPEFAGAIAATTDHPTAFAHAVVAGNCAYQIVQEVAREVVDRGSDGCWEFVHALLDHVGYKRIGTWLALRDGARPSARIAAIAGFSLGDEQNVVNHYRHAELQPSDISKILTGGNGDFATSVALELIFQSDWDGISGAELPDELRLVCRELVTRYCLSDDRDASSEWKLEQVLSSDPELLVRWIESWFEDAAAGSATWLPDRISECAGELSAAERSRLIDAIPIELSSWRMQRLVPTLVGGDEDIARALFARNTLKRLCPTLLSRDPDPVWLQRALIARDFGHPPEEIAQWSIPRSFGWSGDESSEWQRRIDAIREFGAGIATEERARAVEIIDACVRLFEGRRDQAMAREREERVMGHTSRF